MSNLNTILYVDDDPDDRELMESSFVFHNSHSFQTFAHGAELFDYLNGHTPDHLPCLIILDINMPAPNGLEILDILKNSPVYYSIPVVLFSTASNSFYESYYKRYGVPFMEKPLVYEQLRDCWEKLINYCTVHRRITS